MNTYISDSLCGVSGVVLSASSSHGEKDLAWQPDGPGSGSASVAVAGNWLSL